MKVVIDTNVLLISIPSHSLYHSIIQAFHDNKFTDAYINGNADYLVTNDTHFDILKTIQFPKINVVSPAEFVKLLKGSDN